VWFGENFQLFSPSIVDQRSKKNKTNNIAQKKNSEKQTEV